jgi:hypothetical protein
MFREVVKWTSCIFSGNTPYFETWIAYHRKNLLVIKCKNVGFDISLKNIFGSLHT